MAKRETDFRSPISTAVVPVSVPGAKGKDNFGREIEGLIDSFLRDVEFKEKQAVQSYNNSRRLTLEDNANRIISKNPNAGDRIQSEADSFISSYLQSIPKENQAEDSARWDKLINIGLSNANENVRNIDAAQATARDEMVQGNFLARVRGANRGYYSTNPEKSNSSREEAQQLATDFKTRLQDEAFDQDGNVRIPPEVVESRFRSFNDEAIQARLLGWYEEQPDKEEAYLFLRNGGFEDDVFLQSVTDDKISEETIKRIRVMDTLSDPAKQELLSKISVDITTANAFEDRDEKAADKQSKINHDNEGARQYNDIFQARLKGHRFSEGEIREKAEAYDALLEADLINATWNVTLKNQLMETPKGRPDKFTYDLISQGVLNKQDMSLEIAQALQSGRIDEREAEAFRLRMQNNALVEQGVAPGPNRDAINRLSGFLDQELSFTGEFLDDKAKQEIRSIRSNANRDFMNMSQDPDRVKSFDEIFEEIRRTAKPAVQGVRRNSLLSPYKTTKPNSRILLTDLSKAFDQLENDRGNLSQLNYELHKRRIWEWKNMLTEGAQEAQREIEIQQNRIELDRMNLERGIEIKTENERKALQKARDERLGVN